VGSFIKGEAFIYRAKMGGEAAGEILQWPAVSATLIPSVLKRNGGVAPANHSGR
jgi:hypothetical protein